MNEQEFVGISEKTLQAIETALENLADSADFDLDFERQGDNVLQITFPDRSQIIINRHTANQEIWVAARAGGFHFRWTDPDWTDTRSGTLLTDALSDLVSQQLGEEIQLTL